MTVCKLLASTLLGLCLAGSVAFGGGQSTHVTLEDGIQALKAGEFAQARRILSEVVRLSPSPENISYLAMAEAGTGDLAQAIADFQQSIHLGNDSAGVHNNLGIAYLKSGQPQDGIRELRLSLARDPKYPAPVYPLGLALLDIGRQREAVPYLEQARAQSPRNAKIWASLIRAQFGLGNSAAALQTVDQAVQAIPADARLLATLAQLCLKQGQAQKARSLLENANEANPREPNIALALARVSLRTGEPKEALFVLRDLPPEAGKPGETMFLRGEAQALTANLVVAESDLSAAVEADPQNVDYLIAYAWVKQLELKYKEALTILDKARALNAQVPAIHYRAAVNYFSLGMFTETIKACEEAIRLAPSYAEAHMLMGVVELQKKDFRAAEAAFRHAVTLKPEAAEFHLLWGVALYKDENFEGSQKELTQALDLNSRLTYAYFYRAQVLAHRGERQKAIADLETAVALQPHYRKAYSELARLYVVDGQREKAATALAKERAEVHRDEDENARLLQEVGALP
jgi:tetratricopeptide (TPR) repeat protein